MDTQDSGTSTEETQQGDSSTGTTDENASVTSEAGTHDEDAETLRKQLSDKDRYIKQLEAERNQGKKPSKREAATEDQDDVITWTTLNADALKMAAKEYKEELSFYKAHGIVVTNEIRERALRDAKARKGLSAGQQQQLSPEGQGGEIRKTETREVPESIRRLRPNMTYDEYLKLKAEKEKKG